MKKLLLASAALLLAMPVVQAQPANPGPTIAAPPNADEMKLPRPARAKGIPTALAIEAAVEANRVCLGNTYKTTAMIADSAGVPIVVISNDGAAAVRAPCRSWPEAKWWGSSRCPGPPAATRTKSAPGPASPRSKAGSCKERCSLNDIPGGLRSIAFQR
jgi:hypothetical protein